MSGRMASVEFGPVTPVVPSSDVDATIAFYVEQLGFREVFRVGEPTDTAAVECGAATVMFFRCGEPKIAEWTAYRIRVSGVEALYDHCFAAGIVHPNGHLARKPWGNDEFVVLDPDGVAITFWQPAHPSASSG